MSVLQNVTGNTAAELDATTRAVSSWRWLEYYRDLILVLVGKEFKVRYKSTVLGYAWSMLHPLAFAVAYFCLFRIVMRFNVEAYPLFLLAALFPWQWISNSVISSSTFFLGNRLLIKKTRFHRATLVYSGVLNEQLNFFAAIPIVVMCMVYYGRYPSWSWLWWLPALLVSHYGLAVGISLLIATGNLFFRDLDRMTRIVMQLVFYATPIVYPVSKVPDGYRWVLYLNPFTPVVVCWRGLFYDEGVNVAQFLAGTAWAALFLVLGAALYRVTVRRFAELV